MKKRILVAIGITLVLATLIVTPVLAIAMSGGNLFRANFTVMQGTTVTESGFYTQIMPPTADTYYVSFVDASTPAGITFGISPVNCLVLAGQTQNINLTSITVDNNVAVGTYLVYLNTSETADPNTTGIGCVGAIRWGFYINVIANPDIPVTTPPVITTPIATVTTTPVVTTTSIVAPTIPPVTATPVITTTKTTVAPVVTTPKTQTKTLTWWQKLFKR